MEEFLISYYWKLMPLKSAYAFLANHHAKFCIPQEQQYYELRALLKAEAPRICQCSPKILFSIFIYLFTAASQIKKSF